MRRPHRTTIVEIDTPFLSMFVRRGRACSQTRIRVTTAAVLLVLFLSTIIKAKSWLFSVFLLLQAEAAQAFLMYPRIRCSLVVVVFILALAFGAFVLHSLVIESKHLNRDGHKN